MHFHKTHRKEAYPKEGIRCHSVLFVLKGTVFPMKNQAHRQPNPRVQKRQLADKEARQSLLEQHLLQLDYRIIDTHDHLLQEQQRQDGELLRLDDELTLLRATPPAMDGRDDARRMRQASKRPLTEKELQLQTKKRPSLGIVVSLFNRQLASIQLIEIRALRQEIRRDYTSTCQQLERQVHHLRTSRPFGQERQLQTELSHLKREYEQLSLQCELLQIEIDSLRNTLP
jgi:hypothetical protein